MKAIGPYRRPVVLPRSIGNVRTDLDTGKAVAFLHGRLHKKGPHMVLVSPVGDVYPVPHKDRRAEILREAYPAWVAGTFLVGCALGDLEEALVYTWHAHEAGA